MSQDMIAKPCPHRQVAICDACLVVNLQKQLAASQESEAKLTACLEEMTEAFDPTEMKEHAEVLAFSRKIVESHNELIEKHTAEVSSLKAKLELAREAFKDIQRLDFDGSLSLNAAQIAQQALEDLAAPHLVEER